jgi:hypothetical protein
MASTGTHETIEELLEAVFFVWSVPRLHNEGQLPSEESLETAVRRVGSWRVAAASLGIIKRSGAS